MRSSHCSAPTAAGKSTAVRTLLGLIAPNEGAARVFGVDPRNPAGRVRVGAMLQVARIPETLRVREHIDLFRSYYPQPASHPVTSYASHSSRASKTGSSASSPAAKSNASSSDSRYAATPTFSSSTSPQWAWTSKSRRALWNQIHVLAARGKTVLLTTHYLEEADALADRIVVLNQRPHRQRRHAHGDQIRHRWPHHPLPHVDSVKYTCVSCRGVSAVEHERSRMVLTAVQAEPVVRELLLEDDTLSDLEITSPALEDAFLALTSQANTRRHCACQRSRRNQKENRHDHSIRCNVQLLHRPSDHAFAVRSTLHSCQRDRATSF